MKILLPIYSCVDLMVSLISIIVQSVIIASYGDCAYSKMGVGIWNGLLLMTTAITLLLASCNKTKKGDWLTILCAMSLTASLVQVGIASAVIYQMSSLQYFEHESHIGSSKDILDIFNHGLNTIGRSLFDNGMKHVQLRTCYNLIPPGQDTTGRIRKYLELVLLGCGVAAICVQIGSLITLRVKRLIISPVIQYSQTVSSSASKDNIATA